MPPKPKYERAGGRLPIYNYKTIGSGIEALCCLKQNPCPNHAIPTPEPAHQQVGETEC